MQPILSRSARSALARHVARQIGLQTFCSARPCRRAKACAGRAAKTGLPCVRAADEAARHSFEAAMTTVEAIVSGRLWPEPAASAELRLNEERAIHAIADCVHLFPEHHPRLLDWLTRYCAPRPSRLALLRQRLIAAVRAPGVADHLRAVKAMLRAAPPLVRLDLP